MSKGLVYNGNIISIREIEDCIRATKMYAKKHWPRYKPEAIQGEEFPSSVTTEYYEVYPDAESGLGNMDIVTAVFWLAGETPQYDVVFQYDYRGNKALVKFIDGEAGLRVLCKAMPTLAGLVEKVNTNGNGRH